MELPTYLRGLMHPPGWEDDDGSIPLSTADPDCPSSIMWSHGAVLPSPQPTNRMHRIATKSHLQYGALKIRRNGQSKDFEQLWCHK